MSRTLDIFKQLQQKLDFDFKKNDINIKSIEELYTSNFLLHFNPDEHPDNRKDVEDLSSTITGDKYKTHRTSILPEKINNKKLSISKESKNSEQNDEKNENNEKDVDQLSNDTNQPEDMKPEDISGDIYDSSGMGILGGEEEPKTAGELGRVFELKKIYSRLTSIETYLSSETENELTIIRSQVSKSIELFEIISSNFNSYKEKLDEIIIMYYKFIIKVYEEVRQFYKKRYSK